MNTVDRATITQELRRFGWRNVDWHADQRGAFFRGVAPDGVQWLIRTPREWAEWKAQRRHGQHAKGNRKVVSA